MNEPIFSSMFEMIDENKSDLIKSMDKDELFPIVSEIDGGIIAYAIGQNHTELIVEALNEHHDNHEVWTDPAGGTHYGNEDDPAKAYE